MSIENSRAIEFFKQVKNQFRKNENGEIDYHSFDKTSNEFKYICSKIPEFFVRSSKTFDVFAYLYYQGNEKDLSYDKLMFEKIKNSGFIDVENFEKDYPIIKPLVEDIKKRIDEAKRKIWEERIILPSRLQKEVNEFQDLYESIIANNGKYEHYDLGKLETLLGRSSGEELKTVAFIYKICYLYDGINNGKWLSDSDKESIIQGRVRIKKSREALNELKKRREEIKRELKKYGFFTTLFSRDNKNEKEKLLIELNKIDADISRSEKYLEHEDVSQNIKEDKNEIIDKYREICKSICTELIDGIRKDYEASGHEELVSKLLNYLMSINNELCTMEHIVTPFITADFNEYITPFNNALRNIEGLANVFLDFEKTENKDLYSLLNIVRKELMNVSVDSEHGVVSNEYRSTILKGGNIFFANTKEPKDIPHSMESLNEEFKELLQIEDAEVYVRKAGELWYKFMLIHPYLDGNGRSGRYLLNALLAHKGFIIPSLYNSSEEQSSFVASLDKYGINQRNIDMVGVEILNRVREVAIDLSGKNRLSKKNSRQSDIWAVNKNPSDVDYALEVLLERKNRITKPLKIFTNCSSKFIINGREIERYIGTVIFSKEIDFSLCLMNNGKNGYTEEDTFDFLHQAGIPYEVVAGKDILDKKDDEDIPETWFIREGYVLKQSLNNSRDNGCEECIVYPDVKSRLMVGYYTDDNNFYEVWGLHFKGLITTNNSWSLLINEKDYRNISVEEAIKTIEKEGFSYTIGSDPFEEVKKK